MVPPLVSFRKMVGRPSMFASPVGAAAAGADGGVWVWPGEAVPLPDAAPANDQPARPRVDDVPWDDLMRRYGRRVVLALVSRGVPLERAKELAQDAWLRVIHRHRAGKIEELSLPGLIITQASFLARDDMRREQRRARLNEPNRQAAREQAVLDPEEQIEARDKLRVVRSVLDRASPNAQRVFSMLYGDPPLTPTEAAAELGISVQRVRQIVCELRKRMRSALIEPERTAR